MKKTLITALTLLATVTFARHKLVGVDNAAAMQNVGATMQFMVFSEGPAGSVVPEKSAISIDLKALGYVAKSQIVELWSGKKVGVFTGTFAPEIYRHGAGMYKISPIE
ncbi:hypothetical protein GOQ04_08620 [Emticicia sp. ODNR4P]|jgi:hypothetical protein|nr:hypothetical protein [Emticicia sp. ODNR4P]